jgi:ATP-binding cassette subfamily B protein
MKTYNATQILARVYKQTLKAVPFSGITGLLNYIAQGLFPVFTTSILSKLFDEVFIITQGRGAYNLLFFYGTLFVLTYFTVYVLQFIASITINAGIYERCTSYNSMKISEKAANLPLVSFENTNLLNLRQRANDCANREILSQIYMSSTIFITNGISVVSIVIVLAAHSSLFIPISILSVSPYFITRLIRGKEFYNIRRHQSKKSRRLEYLWGLFNNKQTIKEMRVMGFEHYITNAWTKTRDEVDEELWQQNIKDGISIMFCDLLRITGYVLSIFLSLFLVLRGNISIGVFGACIIAFKSMQEATKDFLINIGSMPEKFFFARDYFSFLDLEEDKNGETDFKGPIMSIVIKNISFQYPNSKRFALKDVSLEIYKGEKIVVLGENGSGKTTLSKLILGLYFPAEGDVLFNNIAAKHIEKESLYKKISIVSQDFTAYNLSLRENITISDISNLKNDKRIRATLEEVGIEHLINEANDGLDGQLGREFGGMELSIGQWQKIAIARGLFKHSELIILDEPTSALDPLVEAEILEQFIKMATNKTTIIISHRTGLCKLADKIIVMKNGKIREIGRHHDLINNKDEYYKLYTSQAKWYQ